MRNVLSKIELFFIVPEHAINLDYFHFHLFIVHFLNEFHFLLTPPFQKTDKEHAHYSP